MECGGWICNDSWVEIRYRRRSNVLKNGIVFTVLSPISPYRADDETVGGIISAVDLRIWEGMSVSKLKIELLCISLILIKVEFRYLVWMSVFIWAAFHQKIHCHCPNCPNRVVTSAHIAIEKRINRRWGIKSVSVVRKKFIFLFKLMYSRGTQHRC